MTLSCALTKLYIQHTGGGHRALAVGGDTLEVAGVSGVQITDAKARPVRRGPVGNAARLLHHRGVVLQPAHGGQWVTRYTAEELGGLAQRGGDVVHRSFETNEVGS